MQCYFLEVLFVLMSQLCSCQRFSEGTMSRPIYTQQIFISLFRNQELYYTSCPLYLHHYPLYHRHYCVLAWWKLKSVRHRSRTHLLTLLYGTCINKWFRIALIKRMYNLPALMSHLWTFHLWLIIAQVRIMVRDSNNNGVIPVPVPPGYHHHS